MNPANAGEAFRKWFREFACLSPFLIALSGYAQGGFGNNYIWTNTAGGNWTGPTNWTPNGVPGANDSAFIGIAGTYTVNLNSSVAVNSLTLSNGAHTLSITNPVVLTVSGTVLIDAQGVLSFYGSGINFPSNTTVAGVVNWFSGSMGSNAAGGNVVVSANGRLNLLGASNKALYEPVITYGTTVWTNGGNFTFGAFSPPPVTFSNRNSAVFDIRNDQIMSFPSGGAILPAAAGFYNSGLFRKMAGTNNSASFIQVPFHNDGTIQADFGQLVVNNSLSLSSSSVLQFPVSGPFPIGQFGTIAIAPAPGSDTNLTTLGTPGSVQFAGTLNVDFSNGYVPNVGTAFPLMTFDLKQSGFDAAVLDSVSNGFIEVQVPTDARSLIAVIRTTNAPSPPVQTNMPDQTVAVGSTAVFVAPAVGVVPFSYQWEFNGTNLNSETNATLSIINAQTNNAGGYCVTVADVLLRTNTYCASLSVFPLQNFTSQPVSQTVTNGGTVTLNVAVNSQLPVQYQWRRNGENIAGATSLALTVTTNAQLWDSGNYDVLVGSAVGLLVSTDATVTVAGSALPFTNFPGGSVFGVTNGLLFSGTGDNTGATNVPGEPDIESNPASHRLWLHWTTPLFNSNPVVELSSEGSSFDTVLGVFTGPDVTNLTLVASDDDSGRGLASRVFFQAQIGTTYYIAVDGFAGATGKVVLTATLGTGIGSIAQFTSQPQDQFVAPGGVATFSASASNLLNSTYQWIRGGWLKIPGATNATLVISNAGPGDVDTYSVTAASGTNGQNLDSRRATLEIGPSLSFSKLGLLTREFNQAGGGFIRFNSPGVSFPSVSAGSIGQQLINNFNSLTAQGEPATNAVGGSSRWYLLTAAADGTMIIDTKGSEIATLLSVFAGSDVFASPVASDRNSAPDGHSQVRFMAMTGTNYLIEVDGTNGIQGQNVYVNWRLGTPPNTVSAPLVYTVNQGANLPLLNAGENDNVTCPTYQWQCNGVNIEGATNATYQLNDIQYYQCGSYSVVVSNLIGVVTNAIALVNVDSPLKLVSANPAHITGSAPQATVLLLNTNLSSAVWTPLCTNPTPLLPVNYLDDGSVNRDKGFYRLKSFP